MNPISPDKWSRVENLFHQTIELADEDQNSFLDDLDSSEPEIAGAVRQMVHSHKHSGLFLSGSVIDAIPVKENERVGPWRIEEQIGSGGMSTVFLASRDDGQFNRKVAVKFLKGLLPGKDMVRRMHAEQNILAGLNHLNICRLLDAGMTENGRPYFIMEHVDGIQIDRYCSERNLRVDEILDLFEQVCEAVQYAHQRLIVHRDLKPSNILVTNEGVVKLLDFGIAKIVAEDAELDITETQTGLHLMTPEFASPEQVNSGQITTASDIYSLGLILCKLLTGQMPYNVKNRSPLEISRIISESNPSKPSTLAATKSENGENNTGKSQAVELKRKIEGDLDNIVLMALRKEPSRRYQSVGQLLQDIRNYRNDRPVVARGESKLYHLSKFIKRQRVVVASVVMILLVSIVAGLVSMKNARIADEQREIAEARLDDLRNLTGSLMFDVYDSISELPGSTPSLELIVEQTEKFLDMLAEVDTGDTEASLALAVSYRRVGNLFGNPNERNLGRTTEALAIYDKSSGIVEKLLALEPQNPEVLDAKAGIMVSRADVLSSIGQFQVAGEDYEKALGYYQHLHELHPDQGYDYMGAITLLKTGDMLGNRYFSNMKMPDSSLVIYHRAAEIFGEHFNREPDNSRYLRFSGLIHERLGTIYEQLERYPESIEQYIRSMEIRERYAELNPLNTNAIRDKGIAYEKIAKGYLYAEDLENAKLNFDRSFEIYRDLAHQDSTSAAAIRTLAIGHIHQGDIAYHPENLSYDNVDGAKEHFLQSKQLLEKLIAVDSANNLTNNLMNLVNRRLNHINERTGG